MYINTNDNFNLTIPILLMRVVVVVVVFESVVTVSEGEWWGTGVYGIREIPLSQLP